MIAATLNSSQSFGSWQPEYAAHRIATFPIEIVGSTKKPLVSNYDRFGLRASTGVADKFPDATAIGFMAGPRNKLTVLDVDSADERVLADGLDRHGPTPVVARSGSGKFHAYYRHHGERRLIRPQRDRPIDILGGGLVVAPPSRGSKADYQFIQGGLDDLDHLPVMQNIEAPSISPEQAQAPDLLPGQNAAEGHRNNTLWRYCMKAAHSCDDYDALLDVAQTRNEGYWPPMDDAEVVKIARSAWGYQERGENRIGQYGAWFKKPQVESLVSDPYLFALIGWLKAQNGPLAEFWIANGVATAHLGWPLDKLQKTRHRAIELGWIEMVVPAAKGRNAVYRWGEPIVSEL